MKHRTVVPSVVLSLVSLSISVEARAASTAEDPFETRLAAPSLRASPLDARLSLDVPLALASIAIALSPRFFGRGPEPDGVLLARTSVNGLDRGVIGNSSPFAGSLSDGLLLSAIALPQLATLLEAGLSGSSFAEAGKESLVLFEALAITAALTQVVKAIAHRPRPYMYDSETPLEERMSSSGNESFFSGHASVAFSMATAYSYLFSLRHPESSAKLPVWIGSHALAATAAAMRVASGKHFWSDVLVGAAVGSLTGFLVTHFHRKSATDPDLETNTGFQLPVTPMLGGGAYGLSLSLRF